MFLRCYNANGELTPIYPAPFEGVDTGEKDMFSHPYNYDPFTVFNRGIGQLGERGLYTDRMRSNNHEGFRALQREIFGKTSDYCWREEDPKLVERFLCKWTAREVKLIAIIEFCNPSNGYPYWYLSFNYMD